MASEVLGVSDLANRYAGALYELAEDGKAVEAVAEDLRQVRELIAESPELRAVIRTPVQKREIQAKALDAVLEKAGAHEITRKFVGLVAMKRRLFALPAMIDGFLKILADRRGELSATVRSAKKLTEKQRSSLAASLKQAMGTDVTIEEQVDPAVLGGLVVRVGSRMIDSSLQTKLQSLKLAMKGIG